MDAFNRENEEYRKAHWQQRNQTRGQMGAMHRERQATQADAQQNLGVLAPQAQATTHSIAILCANNATSHDMRHVKTGTTL